MRKNRFNVRSGLFLLLAWAGPRGGKMWALRFFAGLLAGTWFGAQAILVLALAEHHPVL